jgi:hypothetical protein
MSWLLTDGNGIAPDDWQPLIVSEAWPDEDIRGDNIGRRDGENTLNCFVSEYAGQKVGRKHSGIFSRPEIHGY